MTATPETAQTLAASMPTPMALRAEFEVLITFAEIRRSPPRDRMSGTAEAWAMSSAPWAWK